MAERIKPEHIRHSGDSPISEETPGERRARFLLEFDKPYKCRMCNERFKKRKFLLEHKSVVHSY
jgi:hypothetical protein